MPVSSVILLVLFLVLVCVFVYKRHQKLVFLRKYGIPGPRPNFFLGNSIDIYANSIPTINKWIKEYGKVFAVYEWGPTVYIADPEFARQVLVKDFPKFAHRRTMLLEGGPDAHPEYELSVASYEIPIQRWKEQRALIASAFTSSKIKASVTLMNENIDDLMDNIENLQNEEDFDIFDLFQRLAIDTIGRSAFGKKLNAQKNPQNEFFLATKRIFDGPSQAWKMIPTFFSLAFPELFYFVYPFRKLQRILLNFIGHPSHFAVQLQMCIDITRERKEKKMKGEETPDDLLQQLIDASLTSDEIDMVDNNNNESSGKGRAKIRMNDKEIAANANLMFDAGYETSSSYLGFMAHVLVNRQDVQDEVRNEVQSITRHGDQLDHNAALRMPYLDSVMHETLRFFPPVTGFVSRQSATEYKYKDITIPADVSVTVAVAALHRDPEYWQDPDVFDPLRFYGENKKLSQSPAFQAFGSGPRNCAGMRFALMEVKLTIARILSQYKLVPGPRTESFADLEIEYKLLTQNPKKGVFVKAIKV